MNWHPIETAPKDGKPILVWHNRKRTMKRILLLTTLLAGTCLAQMPCQYQSTISYGGGGVMSSSMTVYVMFYGDFTYPSFRTSLFLDFLENYPSGESWYILHGYCDNFGAYVTPPYGISFSSAVVNETGFGYGTTLGYYSYQNMIEQLVENGTWNADSNALYVVITHGVTNSGGYHSSFTNGYQNSGPFSVTPGTQLHYIVANLGAGSNPAQYSPNGDGVADYGVNILHHEWAETMTDPNNPYDGWTQDGNGGFQEIADVCQYTFPRAATISNGTTANITLASQLADSNNAYYPYYQGARSYYLQGLWKNVTIGGCDIYQNWANTP